MVINSMLPLIRPLAFVLSLYTVSPWGTGTNSPYFPHSAFLSTSLCFQSVVFYLLVLFARYGSQEHSIHLQARPHLAEKPLPPRLPWPVNPRDMEIYRLHIIEKRPCLIRVEIRTRIQINYVRCPPSPYIINEPSSCTNLGFL